MRQAKNLYQYLYNSLASQIECGYLQPGQMLPSQPRLCEQYNVGITTVRKVVQMLAQDGYVRQTAGKPAQVIEKHQKVMPARCSSAEKELQTLFTAYG